MSQIVVFRLPGALADAVAVEWTDAGAPVAGAAGWRHCTALGNGRWRLDAADPGVPGRARIGLRCRLVADGPWASVSLDREALEISERAPVPPILLLTPVLAGTGKVGSQVVATPGLWGGEPAPEVTRQWCRDGAEIPGATGRAYVPGPEDDLTRLTCRVSAASPAGTVTATTAALAITRVAPEPAGTMFEEIFDQHSDVQTVAAAPFFRGEALRFTVTGAGASVDAETGEIRIPTEAAISDTVIVTARNSGGAAAQSFPVTVEEAVEIPEPPAALGVGDWEVYWDVDPTQDGVKATWHFAVGAGPARAATRLFWRGRATADGATPDGATPDGATPGAGFHACIPHPSRPNHWIARAGRGTVEAWLWVNSPDPACRVVGRKLSHIAVYTCDALAVAAEGAVYSPVSNVVEKVVTVEASSKAPPAPTPARRMPLAFRSETGIPGYVPADAMQQWHALDWCRGDPDVIYGMQDSGGLWLSRDHGRSWYLPSRVGLESFQGLGVAVDPIDPRRVLCNMGGSYASNRPYQGLYASTDGGMTFGPRIVAGVTDSRRGTHSAMAHAPGSIGIRRAEKWLAIVDGRFEDGDAQVPIMASTDGWASWTRRGTWDQARFGASAWMTGDRTDEGRFYVACGQGLVRIGNAFSGTLTFTKLSGQGGLPGGGIAGKPYVSDDGRTIIVGTGEGIYRTDDGGASWRRVGSESGFAKLQVNPYDPSHMILIYGQRSRQQRPKYSTDGGARFAAPADAHIERRPGLSYTPLMMYNFAHAAFHSTPGNVWLCGRQTSLPAAANHYRTTDHGARWSLSTEGFSGANFANRGVSPFMFSPTDRDRFALSFLDIAIWLTNTGGRYFTPSTYSNEQTGRSRRSTYGVSLHPDAARRTLFGAVGTGGTYVMVRSLDDGGSWDLPLGPDTRSGGNLIAFDLDDPAHVFWGRHRNTGHGAGPWTPMPGLDAGFAVWGCTLTARGMAEGQAIFALDLGASVSVVRRSLDRGRTWTEVLAMPYDNRGVSSRYGPFRAHPHDPDVLFTKGPNGHTIRRWLLSERTPASRPFMDLNILGDGKRPGARAFEAAMLAIDPRFPEVMYVLTTHAGSPRLYRTADGGATPWTPLPEVFPLVCNANAIEVSPVTGDVIIGGSNGTFIAPPPYAQAGTLSGSLPRRSYLQATAW